MVVIAFSGVGNTGKSTLIQKIKEKYQDSIPLIVLGENARDAINTVGKDNRSSLQQEIFNLEVERAERLNKFKDDYGLILVDRPRTDNLAYLQYNILTGQIREPVSIKSIKCECYDYIINFWRPIKESNNFEDYSEDAEFLADLIMQYNTLYIRAEKKYYPNAKDSEKEVMDLISEILDE